MLSHLLEMEFNCLAARQPVHGLCRTKETKHLDQYPVAWHIELHSNDLDLERNPGLTVHSLHLPINLLQKFPGWGSIIPNLDDVAYSIQD